MNKNENINNQSEQSLKEFNKKRTLSNIRLHKFIILILSLTALLFFIFIIIYQKKIKEIRIISGEYSTQLGNDYKSIHSNDLSYSNKLVNIAARSSRGKFRFSMLFETCEEVEMVQNFILEKYRQEKLNQKLTQKYSLDKENLPNMFMMYESGVDGDYIDDIIENCQYRENFVVLIKTKEGRKFGIFFKKAIIPDGEGEFESGKDKNCFVFSFITKNMYSYTGSGDCLKIENSKGGKKFVVGGEDIIINDKFWTKGGRINFPFKNFDVSTINSNQFTERQGVFPIENIEVFTFPIDSFHTKKNSKK